MLRGIVDDWWKVFDGTGVMAKQLKSIRWKSRILPFSRDFRDVFLQAPIEPPRKTSLEFSTCTRDVQTESAVQAITADAQWGNEL